MKTGGINIKGRDKEQQRRKEKEECRSKQQRRGLRDSETRRLGALGSGRLCYQFAQKCQTSVTASPPQAAPLPSHYSGTPRDTHSHTHTHKDACSHTAD